jgi:1-deoxyxylulose-5-phosphate synthase
MEYVTFGNTGLRVSRMAMGTGTHGWAGRSEQTALGLDGLANLLRAAYDRGINFWDTADQYGSHPHVARALEGLPRDQVVIATKTTARSARDATRSIERILQELGTDYVDIVLLHSMTQGRWPKRYAGAMEALAHAKDQGKVRAVGISVHSLDALRKAVETDWVDVVLARINYAGIRMDGACAEVTPVLEQLYDAGKAVYGMKVLGCGQLVNNARTAIEYVFQLGTVHAVTIGISKAQHLEENRKLVAELAPRYPLNAP